MKDFVIAVILAVLIVITILHDISIYRLGRKVDILQAFIDVTMRQLEKYALGQKSNADQRIQDVESVGSVEADDIGDCNICRFAGCSECDDCINGSQWVRETEIDDLD